MTFVEALCALAETGPNLRRSAEGLSKPGEPLWKAHLDPGRRSSFFRAFTDFLFPLAAG